MTTLEIASRSGGELIGDPDRVIRGVAPLEAAGPEDITFLGNPRYARQVRHTRAGAVLIPVGVECELPESVVAIRVSDPYAALAWLLPALYPQRQDPPGIHPTAIIGDGAEVGEDVRIEAYAVVGAGARIGARVRIGAHTVVGEGSVVGADSVLHPQVTLYPGVVMGERCIVHSGARLGSDGFSYLFAQGAHQKIPHVGRCVLGDDVEIGANTTIDRGSVRDTEIGSGTKLDNLVQIGHNTRIGRHVLIISQVGISGSTVIEDGAVIGGQAATSGHLTIGAGARVAGRSAVMGDIPAGETVSGYPARPHRESMRAQAALLRLPGLVKRVQQIEKTVFGDHHSGEPGSDEDSTRSDG